MQPIGSFTAMYEMGLPFKKFPEFNGYAVFMNEELQETITEDTWRPSIGCSSISMT